MRYITRQQHTMTCGPVAIMNLLKCKGWKGSYRDNIGWFKLFGLSKRGMWWHELESVIRFLKIKFKRLDFCNVRDLESALNRGNPVILNYQWYVKDKNSGHFVFIDGHTNYYMNAYNFVNKKNEWKESKKFLRKCFEKSKKSEERYHGKPTMWEIL